MKQETYIDTSKHVTITTLETTCAHCNKTTKHVAHQTQSPPFNSDQLMTASGFLTKGYSFVDWQRIVQEQQNRMIAAEMAHSRIVAGLHEQIATLHKAIDVGLPARTAAWDEYDD